MQLVRLQDAPRFEPPRLNGRDSVTYHDLLTGREGAPDNFALQLVSVNGGYATGRHRHNFEQVRIMLDGAFEFGPGLVQPAGTVGYFCEGTHYTQQGDGRSQTLLLQVGGPSGAGYMSRRQLRNGIAALRGKGDFADGCFNWVDAHGIRHSKDSYEAVWEHVHRRPIQYVQPQYSAPVLMDPERFSWVPMPGNGGVWLRTLGRFNERGLAITQLRVAAGAELILPRGQQVLLLACVQGSGQVATRPYERLSAVRVEIGDAPHLRATRESVFYGFELPRFD
ncbi:MAG: hypothetical protein IPM15_18095 [Betaproteobacteria bacterium]|nr:hypothetical protein [Betaproteobacteria bacterium]MCC6246216.1 hypothetical protein [Rubrivivax sp.]MCL4697927.1 hypothetical protein [Burkholderiaceae bacterium]